MPIDSAFGEDAFGDDDDAGPTCTNIVPAPGSTLSPSSSFQFDVLDDMGLDVLRVEVRQGTWQVAYEEGAFMPAFRVNSLVTTLPDDAGYRFVLRRVSGWTNDPIDVRVTSNDTEGTLAT